MGDFQKVFLITLPLFANLKLMSAHYDYDYFIKITYYDYDYFIKITFRISPDPALPLYIFIPLNP